MSTLGKTGILALLTLVTVQGVNSASLDVESKSELVTLKLYRFDSNNWSGKELDFKTAVHSYANTYCSTTPSLCGLAEWIPTATFNSSSIVVSVSQELKDLEVSFYIVFPSGANVSSASSTNFVVNKVAAKIIVTNTRVDVEHVVGTYVTYIEDVYYGIPPDNIANQVIIPIAFAVLVAVIVAAIILHLWNKRKTRRHHHHKKQEISSSKVTPSHTEKNDMGKNIDTHHNLKGSNVNNTPKEVHQIQKVVSPPTNISHTNRSNNEFIEVDETNPRSLPPPHLPSLPSEDADGDLKKDRKHKKKKKKKHRRQHSEEIGNGQSDSENTRKHSRKSQEHYNQAFNEDNLYDSDY